MILNDIKYFPFSLQLKSEFKNSSISFNKRDGFIIRVLDEHYNMTYGEASPFPYFSYESLKELEEDIKTICSQKLNLSENIQLAISQIEGLTKLNSLRFALEQIFINLLFARNKKLPTFLKQRKFKDVIEINALIDLLPVDFTIQNIQEKFDAGYKTFKIKIGRNNFTEDLLLLENINKKFDNKIKIRLDANRKWEYKNAKSYLKELSNLQIEFIEEPCKNLESNLALAEDYSIIALDESIKNIFKAKEIIDNSNIKFIILKPMIYGALFDSIKLINYAEEKDKIVIISSTFESPIAKSLLVLIASYTSHKFAHGLDTINYFQRNICEDYYKVDDGIIKFNINDFPPAFIINHE